VAEHAKSEPDTAMPITTTQIARSQADRILQLQEGHFADVKAIEVSPAKLSKAISAFANADGGELYIGVDEDKRNQTRSWRGFENLEAANGHLQLFEKLFPLGQDFSYTFLASEQGSGLLLQIVIQKTREVLVASDGVAYLRRGAQSLPVQTPEEYNRLRMNKGLVSFETEPVQVDPALIVESETLQQFLLNVVPSAEPYPWLKKNLLIVKNMPTVAGVLLFADEPQAILPKRCAIKLYRYKTRAVEGTRDTLAFDPLTVEGCLYGQIRSAVSRTIAVIEGIQALGSEGFEAISYPAETLHEIITNAVLHRDYSLADDVHVRIFDNRVEVESPGRLPAHITVANILHERFARNGAVVRMINKFPDPPNKDVGEGLNTAFEAMRKLRLKEPIIYQRENSVLVTIRHEPLASPEEIVMNFLDQNDRITNSKGREICHIGSENEMKRIFQRLSKRDLVELIPGLRGGARAYRKKSGGGPTAKGALVEDGGG
jgi:ATP-dependent DNA helicase RecG